MHHILELIITFQLPGCDSLKDKRRRLAGMKDRFGKRADIAVRECGLHEDTQRGQWAFVIVAENRRLADKIAQKLEQEIIEIIDANIISVERQFL